MIRIYWFLCPKWKFKFCARNANFSAYNLAKWALFFNWNGAITVEHISNSYFCDGGHPIVDSFNFY